MIRKQLIFNLYEAGGRYCTQFLLDAFVLNKGNDPRVANILEYSQSYTNLTDAKADELIKNAMRFQKQRDELVGKSTGPNPQIATPPRF